MFSWIALFEEISLKASLLFCNPFGSVAQYSNASVKLSSLNKTIKQPVKRNKVNQSNY